MVEVPRIPIPVTNKSLDCEGVEVPVCRLEVALSLICPFTVPVS